MAVEIGEILEGKVSGVTKFGAFVALPNGQSGMVHISEISSEYIKEIDDHIKVNDIVKVKVLGIDEKNRISLSIKKANEPKFEPKKVSIDDMINKFMQESNDKTSMFKKPDNRRRVGAKNNKQR